MSNWVETAKSGSLVAKKEVPLYGSYLALACLVDYVALGLDLLLPRTDRVFVLRVLGVFGRLLTSLVGGLQGLSSSIREWKITNIQIGGDNLRGSSSFIQEHEIKITKIGGENLTSIFHHQKAGNNTTSVRNPPI